MDMLQNSEITMYDLIFRMETRGLEYTVAEGRFLQEGDIHNT